jgi:hypothetical protein
MYGLADSETAWELQFQKRLGCFVLTGWKAPGYGFDSELLSSVPTSPDSGLKILLNFREIFAQQGLGIIGVFTPSIRYSTMSPSKNQQFGLVEKVYSSTADIKRLTRLPFKLPLDPVKWEMSIDRFSRNEVRLLVRERTEGVAPRQAKSVEYFYTARGGVMYLTQIIDRHELLKKSNN